MSLKINFFATVKIEHSHLFLLIRSISAISILLSLAAIPVLMIRRMHDANLSGIIMILTLLPLVIFKSDITVNNYASKPRTKNILQKVFAILALVLILWILS